MCIVVVLSSLHGRGIKLFHFTFVVLIIDGIIDSIT